MTFTNAVTDLARRLLNDTAGTVWLDAELLAYLNACRRLLWALRPDDCRVDADGEMQTFADAGLTGDLQEPDKYALCLAHGVCWHAFQRDFGDPKHREMGLQHKTDFFDLAKVT
jgi:hypothetical protein